MRKMAEIKNEANWGMRKMAYEIDRRGEADYRVWRFTGGKDLLDELDHRETDLVVIDCRRPVVSVETLLALGPELPPGARIVLWGERADLEHRLSTIGIALPQSWVCCGPHASAEDVGAVCRVLLD